MRPAMHKNRETTGPEASEVDCFIIHVNSANFKFYTPSEEKFFIGSVETTGNGVMSIGPGSLATLAETALHSQEAVKDFAGELYADLRRSVERKATLRDLDRIGNRVDFLRKENHPEAVEGYAGPARFEVGRLRRCEGREGS